MPKQIIDYSKNIIYKFVCNDLNIKDTYVGHTTNFIKRKQKHKSVCYNQNDTKHNLKVYKMIRDNGNWNNWSMIEIEKYPCNDKNEACARERYWYELLNANMNTLCPTLNVEKRKEYNKEYNKEYRDNNKEQIKANKSKVCICEICNKEYTHNHKSRHEKSKFHLNQITKT